MATNKKIVDALTSLVESSQIANETNLAILATLKGLANQEPIAQDNSELVAQFTQAMESAKTPELVPVSHVPNSLGQNLGHSKPRKKTASDKVREHLVTYPQDRYIPVRDLAAKIGVGKSTVGRVLTAP